MREAVSSPPELTVHLSRMVGAGRFGREDHDGGSWHWLETQKATCPYKLAEVAARFV